jgi:hypothetical protein
MTDHLFLKLKELERIYDQDFFDKVKIVKEGGFSDEFLDAVKEEEQALQKICLR